MIPFKDDNPTRHFPIITVTFIAMNCVVFFYQYFLYPSPNKFVLEYGAIPHFLITLESPQPVHPLLTVGTAMFMHGGFFHIVGNMLYLWIFGNNIEDQLGTVRFVIFYFLCGIIASYTHAILDPKSLIPMVGASGAISGVLGAYVVLFPRTGVYTLLFLGFFVQVVRIPALVVIGLWFFIQVINGLLSTGSRGGVAWFAHIGGFIAGIVLIKLFVKKRRQRIIELVDWDD
jgi:membrane associated rhomboid family serine protease